MSLRSTSCIAVKGTSQPPSFSLQPNCPPCGSSTPWAARQRVGSRQQKIQHTYRRPAKGKRSVLTWEAAKITKELIKANIAT
eukprot:1743058-Amphidinium_carterae.1